MFGQDIPAALRNVRLYSDLLNEIRGIPGVEVAGGDVDFRQADPKLNALLRVVTPGTSRQWAFPCAGKTRATDVALREE